MEADKKTTTEEVGFLKKYGFYLALIVLAVIVMLPNPEGLSVAGQSASWYFRSSSGQQRQFLIRSAPVLL